MWRHNLKDWEKVNKDVFEFCFNQAEKRLKEVLHDSEKITDRIYTLIGIVTPLLSICVGVVLKHIIEKTKFDFIVYLSVVCVIVLGGCVWQLTKAVSARNNWLSGTEPRNILQTEYVEIKSLVDDEPIKYMYLSELEAIQYKIDQNQIVNVKRIGVFNKCLKIVILTTCLALAGILTLAVT